MSVFRAIVCLQIVGMHVYYVDLVKWVGAGGTWAVTHLRFGYESFFVLAGFFLAHAFRPGDWSYVSVPKFFCRRLLRLFLPYWAALGFGFAGYAVREWATGAASPLDGFVDIWPAALGVQDLVVTPSPSVAYWFMAPLLQFYLLWGALFWTVRRTFLRGGGQDFHDKTLRVMTAVVAAGMFASLGCWVVDTPTRWSLARNGVFLCLGCLVYWGRLAPGVRRGVAVGATGLVAVGLYHGQSRPLAAVVCAALLPHVLRHPKVPGNILTRGLAVVGERSFSIYLTHTYIAPRVLKLTWPVSGHDSAGAAVALWGASILAAIAFGWVFHALVEQPTARLARRIQFRGPA